MQPIENNTFGCFYSNAIEIKQAALRFYPRLGRNGAVLISLWIIFGLLPKTGQICFILPLKPERKKCSQFLRPL
jgi:hypothetical protein